MATQRPIERFERGHRGSPGEPDALPLAHIAAVIVAAMAALLAVATFLSNEAIKAVITGETHRAATSSRLENNQLKTDVASGNATMLRAMGTGPAAAAAERHQRRIQRDLLPSERTLSGQMRVDERNVEHHNTKHLLEVLAEAALEVGIALATVSIVANRRWVLGCGSTAGIVGTILLLAGVLAV